MEGGEMFFFFRVSGNTNATAIAHLGTLGAQLTADDDLDTLGAILHDESGQAREIWMHKQFELDWSSRIADLGSKGKGQLNEKRCHKVFQKVST